MTKNENYIEEELSNMPKAIPIDELKVLSDLIKTHICIIAGKDGSHGTGFFCNILNDCNILKVLVTNNHVLNSNDIQPGQTINFSINNDLKKFNILIDNTRKTYTNEIYDVTIIEIKKDDNIDLNSFFELDNQIFKENSNEIFTNCQIYLLHYPNGLKMEISNGVIKSINEDKDNSTIYYLCDVNKGFLGGPIINNTNFQVIGIHKGGEGAKNDSLGTLLNQPIKKFIE